MAHQKTVEEPKSIPEEDPKTETAAAGKQDEPTTPTTPEATTKDGGRRNSKKLKQQPSTKKRGSGSSDPFRFQGSGADFRGKIIGIQDIEEAKGDETCRAAMEKAKQAVKAAGQHKQRIFVNVSLDGIKIKDQTSGEELHKFPVSAISFISRDVGDYRAFGFIHTDEDKKYQFYGIKTEKPADNVVLAMRDMFAIVFEMRQKRQDGDGAPVEATNEKSETEKLVDNQAEELPKNENAKSIEPTQPTSTPPMPAVTNVVTEVQSSEGIVRSAPAVPVLQTASTDAKPPEKDPFGDNFFNGSSDAAPVMAPSPPPTAAASAAVTNDLLDIFSSPPEPQAGTTALPVEPGVGATSLMNNANPFIGSGLTSQTSNQSFPNTLVQPADSSGTPPLGAVPPAAQPIVSAPTLLNPAAQSGDLNQPLTSAGTNPFTSVANPNAVDDARVASVPCANPEGMATPMPVFVEPATLNAMSSSAPNVPQDPYSKLVGSIDDAVKGNREMEKKDPFYDLKHVQKPKLIDAMDTDRSSKALAELSTLMNTAQLSSSSALFASPSSPVFGATTIAAPVVPSPANPFQTGSIQANMNPSGMTQPYMAQSGFMPGGQTALPAGQQQMVQPGLGAIQPNQNLPVQMPQMPFSQPSYNIPQSVSYTVPTALGQYVPDGAQMGFPAAPYAGYQAAGPYPANPYAPSAASPFGGGPVYQSNPVFHETSSLGIFDPSESFLAPSLEQQAEQQQQQPPK